MKKSGVVLQQLQTRYAGSIDREIQSRINGAGLPATLGQMIRYQFGYDCVEGIPAAGASGKRSRPALCLFACECYRGEWSRAVPVAAAIECLHNFSLIHDDIEDDDPVRRHRPTVWKVWGKPQAINTGDALFALAGQSILDCDLAIEMRMNISSAFQGAALNLTRGQYLDMEFEQREDVSPANYLEMITLKTGELLGFALWAGARIADADEMTCARLRQFGRELGRAFQIHDDVQGIWGEAAKTGKQPAKDLENRKKTLPTILAAASASPSEAHQLCRFFSRRSDDLQGVRDVLESLGARVQAEAQIHEHLSSALAELELTRLSEAAKREFSVVALELTGND